MPQFNTRSWRRWLVLAFMLLLSLPWLDAFQTTLRIVFQSVVTLLLGAWLLSLIVRRRPFPATRLDMPFLLFFAAATLSTIFAVDPRISLEGLWRLGIYILLFYFSVDWMREHGTRTLVEPLLFTAALVIVGGALELLLRYSWWFEIGGFSHPLPPVMPRLSGLLAGNPNRLAGFLSPLVPVLFGWGLSMRRRDMRLALLATGAGGFALAALAMSRGGLLALAAGLGVFVVLLAAGVPAMRERASAVLRNRRLLAAGAVALAAGLPILIRLVTARTWSPDAARLDLWRSAWLAGLSQPLTGVGPAGYPRARRLYGDPWIPLQHHNHTHSLLFQAWADGGLLGVLVLAVVVGALVAATVAHWQRTEGPARIRLAGVAAGLSAFATHSLVETFLAAVPNSMVIVFMVITLAAYVVVPLELSAPARVVRRFAPAAILALLMLSAVGWTVSHIAQSRLDRSVELAESGDLAGALQMVRSARRLDPHIGLYTAQEAQYLGELALVDPSCLPAARQAFEAALADESTSGVMYANYAAVLAASGDMEAAQRALQSASAIEPDEGEYRLWSGVLAEQTGDDAHAVDAYIEALELEPVWVGSAFWGQTPLRSEARDAFLEAYALEGTPTSALAVLVPICWPANIPDHWHGWGGPNPDLEPYCDGLRALVLDGNPAEAVALLSRAIEVEPGLAEAYTARAEARLALGQQVEAGYDLRVAAYLGDRQADYRLGTLAEQRGDLLTAEQHYLDARVQHVHRDWWDGIVYQRFGQIRYLPGLEMPASLNLDPYFALLRLYEAQGSTEEAAGIREDIVELNVFWQANGAARQPASLAP